MIDSGTNEIILGRDSTGNFADFGGISDSTVLLTAIVTCQKLQKCCHTSHIAHQTSHITHQKSQTTNHKSQITHQTSHITLACIHRYRFSPQDKDRWNTAVRETFEESLSLIDLRSTSSSQQSIGYTLVHPDAPALAPSGGRRDDQAFVTRAQYLYTTIPDYKYKSKSRAGTCAFSRACHRMRGSTSVPALLRQRRD